MSLVQRRTIRLPISLSLAFILFAWAAHTALAAAFVAPRGSSAPPACRSTRT